MLNLRYLLLGLLVIGGWIFPQTAFSETVTLVNSSGDSIDLDIDSSDKFLDVLDRIRFCLQTDDLEEDEDEELEEDQFLEKFSLNHSPLLFQFTYAGLTIRAKTWRDYYVPVNRDEKEQIRYIVTTLANESPLTIGTSFSALRTAGAKIDHLHPFRFLLTIFCDEKLKVGAHAIRDRGGLVWDGFTGGVKRSLTEETKTKNVLPFVSDFAKKVKIDENRILPSLKEGNWIEFVNILIDEIPRDVDPNRYNM